MPTLQQLRRHYTKLAKLGSKNPLTDAERLAAFHGTNLENNLRQFSVEKTNRDAQGLARGFPAIGRALKGLAPQERTAYLEIIEQNGLKRTEELLKNGFSLRDVKEIPSHNLADVKKYATKQNMLFFAPYGLSTQAAKQACMVFKEFTPAQVSAFLGVLEQKGIHFGVTKEKGKAYFNPATLRSFMSAYQKNPAQVLAYFDVILSRTVFAAPRPEVKYWFFAGLVNQHGLEKATAMAKGNKVFISRKTGNIAAAKNVIDYRRAGRVLNRFRLVSSSGSVQQLAQRGINLFPGEVNVKRVISSTESIEENRRVVYLQVPKFRPLLSEAKKAAKGLREGHRQHVAGALAFADVRVFTKQPQKLVYLQELQSDIVPYLSPRLQQKYDSWAKILILSTAKAFERDGIEFVGLSTPRTIQSIWGGMGKEKLEHTYYTIPREMGFTLSRLREPTIVRDVAYGQIRFGYLDAMWKIQVSELKAKYPEFFSMP